MAAQFAQLALKGAEPLIQNYDVIYEKGKDKVKKVPVPGRKASKEEQDRYYQSRGYDNYYQSGNGDYSRDRDQWNVYRNGQSNGYSDDYGRSRYNEVEEIPRDFPPPQGGGRANSADRYGSQRGGQRSGRQSRPRSRRDYSSSSSSDSESSIPPRRRFRDDKDERMAKYTPAPDPSRRSTIGTSTAMTSTQNNEDHKSSSESSDVISSSEDERQRKKVRGKELLTGALAAVATVHAASGVYSSMEARDKRYEQVKSGKLSPEEARKQKTKALLQDFAAVGVAALSIKGAYGKWEGARAQHKQFQEHKEAERQRHEKRLRKMEKQMKKQGQGQGQGYGKSSSNARPSYNRGYSTSAPDLTQMNRQPSGPPRYQDGNPYSAYRGR